MAVATPNAVTSVTNWKFQNSYIERLMDHSALTSAHPDDTLILAGPPRMVKPDTTPVFEKMLPIGMIQQMQLGGQIPTVPAMAIGSGRGFYLSSKAQYQGSIARLFVNGRNLLRALMTNAIVAGIDVTKFDDAAAASNDAKFFVNLDSELFRMPFGMAVLFRDKIHNDLGAVYLELCMLTGWNLGIGAGQSMIMENATFLYERARPMSSGVAGEPTNDNLTYYDPTNPSSSDLFEAIFQGTGIVDTPGVSGTGAV